MEVENTSQPDVVQQQQNEVNRQRHQQHVEERGQNLENEGVDNNAEGDQSKGTVTRRVPHLEREMDQMKRSMEEMKDSMRRANQVNDLVHKTDSPFIASIISYPLPSKFKMPTLDSYVGTHDPCDHIATFKTIMHLQGVPEEIICRAFPTTLKGPARVWFSKLLPNTITLFQELSKFFVNNLFGGQRQKHSSSSLLNIEQGENESLRTFISRFNREALLVDEMDDKDDKILLEAFYNGVSSDLFIHKLYNQEP